MSSIKRVDPHRPYRLTPDGTRRIVLGETGSALAHGVDSRSHDKPASKQLRTATAPQRWHMAVVHSDRGRLDEPARQAIAAAAILATTETGVLVVVLGDLTENLAVLGADLVAVLPELDGTRFQPEREVTAVTALITAYKPEHVIMPDIPHNTGDLGRRLIAAHGYSAAVHVVEIEARHVSVLWSGGAEVGRTPLPRFILLEPGAVDADLPFKGEAQRLSADDLPRLPEPPATCHDLGLERVDAARLALEEAAAVVSAGHGVDNVTTLATLAEALGAAVGASRVAVDEGKIPREKQIGATGKSISASLYMAVGISGAVQHLQGIKDCRHVIAVNRDAGAPIVKRADLTVIGDAEELMQALITRISQARAQGERTEAS